MFSRLLMPKLIICVREGFEFFNSTQVFPSKVSQNLFNQRREQAQKIIAIYSLSLDEPLPVSPIEKQQLWNSSIRPHITFVKDLMKYRKVIIKAGLPEKDFFPRLKNG
jgi:hypothetical protein